MLNLLKNWQTFLFTSISFLCFCLPSIAAEKIKIIYGPLNLTLEVDSLEKFAQEGIVDRELEFYLNAAGLKDEQKEALRETLSTKYPIDGVRLSTFLNTPTGEMLLEKMGTLISVPGGRNGKYILRGGLVKAALENEDGLTVLNFLQSVATDIQLNTSEIEEILDYQKRLSLATESLTKDADRLSSQEIAKQNLDYTKIKDIREKGEYGFKPLEVLQLRDQKRQRNFAVDIYQPQRWKQGKTPVVIVSHGLGSNPDEFATLGKQLASYGFLVAIPQHIGSDGKKLAEIINGYTRELYDLEEFINRPLDISYVLDELEKRNKTEFNNRLNLDNVGVLGHSFGGYTALALAGATWDFEHIKTYCDRRVWEANLSMLLQCRTLDLPDREYNFHDERVGAIGVMNPVNSVIFGSQGLSKVKIPIVIGAGTNDPATPAIIEQIRTFAWVSSEDKYLFVIEGQAHFLISPDSNSQINNLLNLLVDFQDTEENIFTTYGNTQATAFLQYYIAQEESFQPYLQPGYWQYIADESYPVYWLDRFAVNTLTETYNRFKPTEIPTLYPN